MRINMHYSWILLIILIVRAWSFLLEGSSTSYAQFCKWNAAVNATLELEFKTNQGSGLLLYTDDGGTYDFFEIKLVEGAVRLRYNLGGGAQIVTVGHDFGDGQWHKVQILRDNENTTLIVDSFSGTSTSRGKEFQFGKLTSNSDVYIGGMPSWYNSKLTLLALPSVIFEPRFRGSIRNLIYANDDNVISRRQEIIPRYPRGIRYMNLRNSTDVCENNSPCQHDGICISTDSGPICECRNGEFEGQYCEKDKIPAEASFRGGDFLKIDLSNGDPIYSIEETVSIQFKTRQHNGLLFYSGQKSDYLTISLRDGGAAVEMVLTNGRLDLHIKPMKTRFDDNQWHKILIQRRVQEISSITRFCKLSAIVDGIYADHAHTAGSFTHLSSSQLLVGGSDDAHSVQGIKGMTNFVGCLRKVFFKTDNIEMELIEAAKHGLPKVTVWGRLEFHCREPKSDPITFTTRDSHLVLPPWKSSKSGSISFKIRTNEPDGVVMYSQSGTSSRTDLFGFELLDGHLYLHIDLGSGYMKIKASKHRVNNSVWHNVTLHRVDRNGRVSVDGETSEFETPGDATQLDLDGLFYLGGIGVPFSSATIPPVFWSTAFRQGFVGCMRDLVMSGQSIDIAGYAQQQDSGAVRPACHVQAAFCSSQPCMHGGECIEGWNRFYCDCTFTDFIGATCSKDASILHLNGSQQMTILMPEDSKTQAEEISVRFRTSQQNGLLLATSLETSSDCLQIFLDQGIAKLRISIQNQEKILQSGQDLNDNNWHNIKFSRRATSISFSIDKNLPIQVETPFQNNAILEFRSIHLGGYLHTGPQIAHFSGYLKQFWFNGSPYIELARNSGTRDYVHQGITPIIRVTGKFEKRVHRVLRPVAFTSKHTFLGLPILKAYVETNVYFQFRTKEANGLILFNAGKGKDFIAIELLDGHVHYIVDLGDGVLRIRDSAKSRLNDGKWHSVTVSRPAPKKHTLVVDDNATMTLSQGSNENLDLDGILYIGGVEKTQYTQLSKFILSRHGFQGCLASFELSGQSVDLVTDAIVTSSLVEPGCTDDNNGHVIKKCHYEICSNRGRCIQRFDSYMCDCDMTSFSGPTCSDEGVAYEFGSGKGIITYILPNSHKLKSTKNIIALGFVTSVNDAVILRVESSNNDEYLEIEIVEGNIFVVYNIGTNDHAIGEVGVKINDNQYHVVRFTRNGSNSTLQVDDYDIQSSYYSDFKSMVHDGQSIIHVGGRWNKSKGKIERAFLGVISGLVINGARIFEFKAGRKNGLVSSLRGDVQQLPPGSLQDKISPLQRMQQTPASGFPGVVDDLIFSGAGSGCVGDDEDDGCIPIYDPNSDDLITPVYIAPTKSPIHLKPKTKDNSRNHASCDDEEDCSEGSGDSSTMGVYVTAVPELSSSIFTTQEEIFTSQNDTLTSTEIATITKYSMTTFVYANVSSTEKEIIIYSTSTPFPETTTPIIQSPKEDDQSSYQSETYPPVPTPPKTKELPKVPAIHSDAAKNAALIIAIIAGALIAIVLIILLILKFKNRPETSYKIDETKIFCQDPNSALLSGTNNDHHFGSASKTNSNISKNGRKREMKDIKEWYV
ncbi:neurexin-3 [Microplitis demolitor]|uniref:neurexin-3 n=1 Tax=Microplitis demolitor TaxID=69319 RepID=UPI0004CD4D72|nr:neurexin-3 [Microplitis demolitor]